MLNTLKKYNGVSTSPEMQQCIASIATKKIADKDIIRILVSTLEDYSRTAEEALTSYCQKGTGVLRVYPTSIQIDAVEIKEDTLSKVAFKEKDAQARLQKYLIALSLLRSNARYQIAKGILVHAA